MKINMKKLFGISSLVILLLMVLLLSNCKKEVSSSVEKIQTINGNVQKGPFISGSSVIVYDLQSDLTPSGKSYNAIITNNSGTFHLDNIALTSQYVGLRADGFYYNEISGKQSMAQITLYGLADLSGKSTININLLTHLEKSRVEYLMKSGLSFSDSKSQAQGEILKIFGFQKDNIQSSEALNIVESGENNAILLAITSILQGNHNEAELTELLSNISEDIKEDGILNNESLGSELINQARFLDTTAIKTNLTNRYNELSLTSNISYFGKYVSSFVSNTKYKFTNIIEYPENGKAGPNVLTENRLDFTRGTSVGITYSVTAKLPREASISVKFIADTISGGYFDPIRHQQIPAIYAAWGLHLIIGEDTGWKIRNSDSGLIPVIENTNSERIVDTQIDLFDHGSGTIEIFENNQIVPTRTKRINW